MFTKTVKYLLFMMIGLFYISPKAYAIPAFARQTGFECTQCHTVFPELTSTGRYFKLSGYTMGSNSTNLIDNFAGMVQVSGTKNSNASNGNADAIDPSKDNKLSLDQVSLFYGGKLFDSLGAFVQYTYDGTSLNGSNKTKDIAHHVSSDNMDFRYAKEFSVLDKNLLLGATINNNPSMQDIYNSTPTWSFPYSASANMNSISSTMVEGGLSGKVRGLGVYAMYDDLVYAEVSGYQSNRSGGLLHFMGYNQDYLSDLHGTALYSRIALQKNIGDNFIMLGGYALNSKIDPDTTTANGGLFDEYKDKALDAEYQYTNGSHIITATATKIWEKMTLNNSSQNGTNTNDTLATTKAKISYYYDQKYGISSGVFSSKGTADSGLYSVSANSSPNSSGKIIELDYLPVQKVKLSLQYTMFDKFNGAKTNYDGNGRNAKDNNNLFLSAWMMF